MADIVQPGVVGQTRYKDMGDGTFASVMYVGASGAGGGPAVGALTDRSGVVAVGGTAQTLAAVNAARKYLIVQNLPVGSRAVADGVTNSTTTVTSATAVFTAADVGAPISGTGIPAGATIVSRTNSTTVIISAAATATASGVTITIGVSVAGPLWVNFTTAAVPGPPSILLVASGGTLVMESSFVSTEAVSVYGATTGQAWSAKEG